MTVSESEKNEITDLKNDNMTEKAEYQCKKKKAKYSTNSFYYYFYCDTLMAIILARTHSAIPT